MKYAPIVFMQDSDATEALKILKRRGPDAAIKHLSQWDSGEYYDQNSTIGDGTNDLRYQKDDYILSYNTGVGYIGLTRQLPHYPLPETIQTISEVNILCDYLYEQGVSFHPDDDLRDIGDTDIEGKWVNKWSGPVGRKMDRLMTQACKVSQSKGIDICLLGNLNHHKWFMEFWPVADKWHTNE